MAPKITKDQKKEALLAGDAGTQIAALNSSLGTKMTLDFDLAGYDAEWDKTDASGLIGKAILGIEKTAQIAPAYKAAIVQRIASIHVYFDRGTAHQYSLKGNTLYLFMSRSAEPFGLTEGVAKYLAIALDQ